MRKNYIMADNQTGGFSAHTTVDGLAEMLIEDWLNCICSVEDYEGEYQDEIKKWKQPTQKMKKTILDLYGYEALEPTPSLIYQWEQHHDTEWEN